jgi:phosphatidylserine decarboxylase
MPLTGMITHLEYHPGGHLPAYTKESEKNERVVLVLKTDFGVVKIVQIAGTIARRVVPYVKPGDRIMRGERIGIIRLGSRLDIYLPEDMLNSLTIRVGDKVQAGVDTIAKLHD